MRSRPRTSGADTRGGGPRRESLRAGSAAARAAIQHAARRRCLRACCWPAATRCSARSSCRATGRVSLGRARAAPGLRIVALEPGPARILVGVRQTFPGNRGSQMSIWSPTIGCADVLSVEAAGGGLLLCRARCWWSGCCAWRFEHATAAIGLDRRTERGPSGRPALRWRQSINAQESPAAGVPLPRGRKSVQWCWLALAAHE